MNWIHTESDRAAWELGYRPDIAAAERVRTFFARFLRHSKGEWARKPFALLPWQWEKVILPLFAWKRPDGTRRFRRGYVEIPKKNGKSTLAAGIALYLLLADNEPGAEVYSAASDRKQASIIFREIRSMVEASPALSSLCRVVPSQKKVESGGNFFESLSADAPSKEGLNIHGLIFDELHAQRDRKLWDALEYGGAARRQPLQLAITTAGWDRTTVCWEQHEKAAGVLSGKIVDPTFFACIFAAGVDDDWRESSTWEKANPSLGTTINRESFAEDFCAARGSPAKENSFKRYRLNIWTEQATRWLGVELWDSCDLAPEFTGVCHGGLDLASTTDLAAFCAYWPDTHSAKWLYWVPAGACRDRERLNKQRFDVWAERGFIKVTPGGVLDYDAIRADVNEFKKVHQLRCIGIDRWNSVQLATQLRKDKIEVAGFGQGFVSLSSPTKELEGLIRTGAFRHGGNPVARWNFGNVAVVQDAAGNVKPTKAKSTEKIDGIVAAIMAVGRAAVNPKKVSVYARRGVQGL